MLLGWALELPRLTDWTNQGISMFPNAALCGILTGAAVFLLATPRQAWQQAWKVAVARALAGLTMLIAGLTVIEHITDINLGIDTLLFDRPWGQNAASAPMRMGVPASTSYCILAGALLLSTWGKRERAVATSLAAFAALIASLSLTGYWFGANQLFGIARFTGIALVASTIIAVLSIAVMALVPEHGVVALLNRDDAGGKVFRRLILPIIFVPLVLGWIRLLGEEAGLYDTQFGTALRSFIEIILFFFLLWWTASSISWHANFAQSAQSRLAAIVESSDDAIVSKTLQGIIQTWNVGAEKTFGYSAEEAVGKHISLIIPPERMDEETQIITRVKRGEPVEHYETIRVRKDGERISVSLAVSPMKSADGRIIGASKIARDITSRKRTEERLRAVVEATPECVKIVSPDGSLEFMNHAGLCMIEANSEVAVRGASVYELIAPEHREAWIEFHKRVCAGEKSTGSLRSLASKAPAVGWRRTRCRSRSPMAGPRNFRSPVKSPRESNLNRSVSSFW